MRSADPQCVDLWLTSLDDQTDARLIAAYQRLLSVEEQRRAQRFLVERDRRRYLVTRALVRTVLARFTGVAPECLAFRENRYGKPALCTMGAASGGLSFNLSHCDDMIVLALTRDRALGVDVENIALKPAPIHIAQRYFAREEIATLGGLPADGQGRRFFELWTLKEAYIKARGMGLAIPLDQFGFRFDQCGHLDMWIHPHLGDQPSRWHHRQIRIAPDYLVGLCSGQREGAAAPGVRTTRTIPLVGDEPIAHHHVRASG